MRAGQVIGYVLACPGASACTRGVLTDSPIEQWQAPAAPSNPPSPPAPSPGARTRARAAPRALSAVSIGVMRDARAAIAKAQRRRPVCGGTCAGPARGPARLLIGWRARRALCSAGIHTSRPVIGCSAGRQRDSPRTSRTSRAARGRGPAGRPGERGRGGRAERAAGGRTMEGWCETEDRELGVDAQSPVKWRVACLPRPNTSL